MWATTSSGLVPVRSEPWGLGRNRGRGCRTALSTAVLWGPLLSSGQADSEQSITVLCLKLCQSSLQVSMWGGGQVNMTLDTRGEIGGKPRERRQAGVSAEGCVLAKEHEVLWMKENLIQSLEELEVTSLMDSPSGDGSGTGLRKMAS